MEFCSTAVVIIRWPRASSIRADSSAAGRKAQRSLATRTRTGRRASSMFTAGPRRAAFLAQSDTGPALRLVVVHQRTAVASREDQHPGTLIADVSGWAGIPEARGDPGGLGQDVVTAVGDLAQLFDRFVEVAALGAVPRVAVPGGAL